ncbi:hypothetical protein, partial [Photorhabdus khanii]|uniref:hypothetical protein n=1 Tax=Photorhabdus khanii TaxID=1004150 RepID=UPI0018646D94
GCPPDSDGVDARHRQRMVLKILTFQIVEHGIGGRRAFGLWRGVALSAGPGLIKFNHHWITFNERGSYSFYLY